MNEALPVAAIVPPLLASLGERRDFVLSAPPGAGKSTYLPLALLRARALTGKLILVQPRRVAAGAVAARLAETLDEPVGAQVGLRMRDETRVSASTRIEVVTTGVLLRTLISDPALTGIGLVLLDEFHERSLEMDLCASLLLHARTLLRDDDAPLLLGVMSATLDLDAALRLLPTAAVYKAEGRAHPVTVSYLPPAARQDPRASLAERAASAALDSLAASPGNALVFLPGRREIDACARHLAGAGAEIAVRPLHGGLSAAAQRAALAPPSRGRAIIVATDIAETSLTVPGVTAVVDGGYHRAPQFDARAGLTRLATRRISAASAVQRAGRAGRLGPGICLRLWAESERLAPQAEPQMAAADLAPLALALAAYGAEAEELAWATPPPAAALARARQLLMDLGALKDGRISAHGLAMVALPAHPRIAHMVLAAPPAARATAARLAAWLEEPGARADISLAAAAEGAHNPALKRAARRYLDGREDNSDRGSAGVDADLCLALAYPERIAQRRGDSASYLLASGRAARLFERETRAPYLVAAELGGSEGASEDIIYAALPFAARHFEGPLRPQVRETSSARFDPNSGRLVSSVETQYGAFVLARRNAPDDTGARVHACLEWVRARGLAALDFGFEARNLCARVALLRATQECRLADAEWPDFSEPVLLETLEQWLTPALSKVDSLAALARVDVSEALRATLPWPLPMRLDEWAPARLPLPSGDTGAVDYTGERPALAAKLQTLFGLQETPRVARGRVPVTLQLLSPAGKPLQITQDLAQFWRVGYHEVKKEMKGRYPRHPWPDDPLTAVATRLTKKQFARSENGAPKA